MQRQLTNTDSYQFSLKNPSFSWCSENWIPDEIEVFANNELIGTLTSKKAMVPDSPMRIHMYIVPQRSHKWEFSEREHTFPIYLAIYKKLRISSWHTELFVGKLSSKWSIGCMLFICMILLVLGYFCIRCIKQKNHQVPDGYSTLS